MERRGVYNPCCLPRLTVRELLAWADAWYPETAFQPWTPFQHPQLGAVEIGGWWPLVRENPPADLLPDLTTRTADFLDSLADDFARLSWEDVEVKALAQSEVFEVRARLVNRGLLPTTTAMGRKNRRPLPLRIYLELPDGGQLLVGRPRTTSESLDGLGGMQELHWIYRLAEGSGPAQLRAISSSAGEALITLEVN